jgi:quinol monooxygenase YgiN
MIVLHGCMRVAIGKREEAITALEALVEGSRAESGCLAFSVSFDIFDDHLLRVVETFEDEAAWAAHSETSHVAEWRTAATLLGVSDLELVSYEAVKREAAE